MQRLCHARQMRRSENTQRARPSRGAHRTAFAEQYLNDSARRYAHPCGMDVFRANPAASTDLSARNRLDVIGNTRGEYIVASARAPEFEDVVKREIGQLRFFQKFANGRCRDRFARLASAAGQRPSSIRSRDEEDAIGA